MTGLLAALPDQQLSLSALAEWVRGLPVSSLAPVGVLFVAGLLLACFGQRLLKPVLVLASMFFGVVLLARLGPTLSASIPPLAWSAIGAVGGIIVAVLSYRLLLGIAMGLVGATVAILLALTAVQLGLIDVTSTPPPLHGEADGERDPIVVTLAAFERGAVAHVPVALAALERQAEGEGVPSDETRGAVAKELDALSPGLGGRFLAWLDQLNGFLGTAGQWLGERWNEMPPPMRTLVTASAATGGFLGLALGVGCPVWAGTMLTSLFGSLLVLLCGAPLVSRVGDPNWLPSMKPLGWLALWMALATSAAIFQSLTRPTKAKAKAKGAAQPADDAEG